MVLREKSDQLRKKRLAGSFEELNLCDIEILNVERSICDLKNEEYAVPIDLGVNVCEPPILVSSYGVALLFIIVDDARTVVLTFDSVEEVFFGGLNDEVFESHELIGRGLDVYGEYLIKNSSLKDNLKEKNKVHDCYDESYWSSLEHYLIRTKDGEFSCLAKSFSLKAYELAVGEVIATLLAVKCGTPFVD